MVYRNDVLSTMRNKVGTVVKVVVATIELKAVDAVTLLNVAQKADKMIAGIRVGEVVDGTLPVPPFDNGWLRSSVGQQIAFFSKVAILWTVGRNKGTDPQHHLKAHLMQTFHHAFRVWEAVRFKLEVPVMPLPVIVYHDDAGREAVFHDVFSVCQYVFLVLVVHQFNPSVVLGHGEKQAIGQLSAGWEVGVHSCEISLAQGRTRLLSGNRCERRIYMQVALAHTECKWAVAP